MKAKAKAPNRKSKAKRSTAHPKTKKEGKEGKEDGAQHAPRASTPSSGSAWPPKRRWRERTNAGRRILGPARGKREASARPARGWGPARQRCPAIALRTREATNRNPQADATLSARQLMPLPFGVRGNDRERTHIDRCCTRQWSNGMREEDEERTSVLHKAMEYKKKTNLARRCHRRKPFSQ